MITNGRGQLNATHLIYTAITDGAATAFSSLATQAASNPPSYWQGWDASTAAPQLIRIADGPLDEIQAKHPCITITPEGGSRSYPMCSYTFDVSYTYACPKILASVDTPLMSCQLAQEALLKIFKDSSNLQGIGWSFGSWSISEQREASTPAPLFSRTLSVSITLQIEEDY